MLKRLFSRDKKESDEKQVFDMINMLDEHGYSVSVSTSNGSRKYSVFIHLSEEECSHVWCDSIKELKNFLKLNLRLLNII